MAQATPFDAAEDVFFTALDGVIEFGYGEGFSHRSLDPQLAALRDTKAATTTMCPSATKEGQSVVKFPQAPVDDTVMALLHSADAVKEVGEWPWPRLGWWWYWSKPSSRRERALRQNLNKHQVELAVQRMQEQKDRSGSFRSAVDCMVDRERRFAEKDGRQPVFWSETMDNEVSLLMTHASDYADATDR